MHTHDDNPCWDAHCAPHLTHHDAAVRELIARAEARGAERERERIAQAIENGPHRLGHNVSVVCRCLRCEVSEEAARIPRTPEATR